MNSKLLFELQENIYALLKSNAADAEIIIQSIVGLTTFVETIPIYTHSPDPKDNFLFDLAIQTNSEVIVTKEKALLNFAASPVAIHDIKWFKEHFPVPL